MTLISARIMTPSIMTPSSWAPARVLSPTPPEARGWLSRELAGPDYQSPWPESVLRWVVDRLQTLFDSASRAANGGLAPVITVLVAVVVIALLSWVLPRVRREPAVSHPSGTVLHDLSITPDAFRKLAGQAVAEGRYDDAVLDGFRAIAMAMSNRNLLDDAPSRTAHEVSLALAPPFPQQAHRIAQAADAFDSVRYGHRRATSVQAEQVRQLDLELVKTRPALAGSPLQDLPV